MRQRTASLLTSLAAALGMTLGAAACGEDDEDGGGPSGTEGEAESESEVEGGEGEAEAEGEAESEAEAESESEGEGEQPIAVPDPGDEPSDNNWISQSKSEDNEPNDTAAEALPVGVLSQVEGQETFVYCEGVLDLDGNPADFYVFRAGPQFAPQPFQIFKLEGEDVDVADMFLHAVEDGFLGAQLAQGEDDEFGESLEFLLVEGQVYVLEYRAVEGGHY